MGRWQGVGNPEDGVSRAMLGRISQSPTGHIFRPSLGKLSVGESLLTHSPHPGPFGPEAYFQGTIFAFCFTGGRTS